MFKGGNLRQLFIMNKSVFFLLIITFFLLSCQQQPETKPAEITSPKRQKRKTYTYQVANAKEWLSQHKTDSLHTAIAYAVNRTDSANFTKLDSVIVPADLTGELAFYLPFPLEVASLKDINKIIYFSYPTQTFAAYEKGILVYAGPTNMGRKKDTTPTGLFFTNWKAEETISTFNDEWELRWNFNIQNKEGIGWHQYALPGYPASHSCLRLQEKDAKYLYNWADEWEVSEDDSVQVKGTPVIVFGTYNFDGPKPWLQLVANPKALDIKEEEIETLTAPFLNEIISVQKSRDTLQLKEPQTK